MTQQTPEVARYLRQGDDEVTDLRDLLSKATPRLWHNQDRGVGWEIHVEGESNPDHWCNHRSLTDLEKYGKSTFLEPDAALIVAAVNRLPLLLNVVEAAQEWVAAKNAILPITFSDGGPASHMRLSNAEGALYRALSAYERGERP